MSIIPTIRSQIFYIRLPAVLLSWFGILYRFAIAPSKNEFLLEPLKFFTIQSNLMVVIWLTLAVVYKDGLPGVNQTKLDQLYGSIKGAFTSFITLTWLGFWFLIWPTYDATGLERFAGIINHFVIPIYFILDWFITENKSYPLKYPLTWLSYPLGYAVFAYLFQIITDDPIYPFLHISDPSIGLGGFLTMVVTLFVGFTLFCFIYFGLNKLLVKSRDLS